MTFDAKKAESLLREVFLTEEIQKQLGVDRETVERAVADQCIWHIQKERLENLPKAKEFKEMLEKRFPKLRFSARVKSLPSIFGKILKHRTTADAFGIKVVTRSTSECYKFYKWVAAHCRTCDFEDRIKNPRPNGYRDLKFIIEFDSFMVEAIVQTRDMYVDAHTVQDHELVYPWKYHDVIKNLPAEYQSIRF